MKYNSYISEIFYALIFLAISLTSGFITSQWILSLLMWAIVYILWKWVELFHFHKWYKNGADIDNIPLSSGIWKGMCNMVAQNKKKDLVIDNKNKLLIQQFESMSQALPYATVLLNKKHEVIWVNNASHGILGLVKNQNEGLKIDKIIQDPVFLEMLEEEPEQVKEMKSTHPNDKKKKIHIKLIKLTNKRYLLVARDISEQESLRQSRKAFVANASHELRTPLTVVAGYLEMIQSSHAIIPQEWKTAVDQAMFQSNRMAGIIDDMLKLSSIEHEQYLEDNDDIIHMSEMLNRLLIDVKNSPKAKHHHFVANINSDLNLSGNQEEIVSICLNLLNNAVIHTKPNTEISLRWFKQNDKAYLWICDNGVGIEQKHLTHLTERFYRVDNSRDKNKSSTGLGLAIVKQICDNHNAKLLVESELNKGSCFKVEFPTTRIV